MNKTLRKNILQFDLLMDYLRLIQHKSKKMGLQKEVDELEKLAQYIYALSDNYVDHFEKEMQEDPDVELVPHNFSDSPYIWINIFKEEMEWNAKRSNYPNKIHSVLFQNEVLKMINAFLDEFKNGQFSAEEINQKIRVELNRFLKS